MEINDETRATIDDLIKMHASYREALPLPHEISLGPDGNASETAAFLDKARDHLAPIEKLLEGCDDKTLTKIEAVSDLGRSDDPATTIQDTLAAATEHIDDGAGRSFVIRSLAGKPLSDTLSKGLKRMGL